MYPNHMKITLHAPHNTTEGWAVFMEQYISRDIVTSVGLLVLEKNYCSFIVISVIGSICWPFGLADIFP